MSAANQFEQLKGMTVVVADTGEIEAIKQFKPTDATTNPSLIFKAIQLDQYKHLVNKAVEFAKANGKPEEQLSLAIDRLAVEFGIEILKIVPGVVSTELDARLSYDVDRSVARAVRIIDLYEKSGVQDARDRVLIKVASTWEGLQASKILRESHGIRTNMTLLFSIWQAAAAAEFGSFLISPFCGRITDWHKKNQGVDSFPVEEDPGVLSVREIYNYYKKFGYKTIVMGASFRSAGQVVGLAGCDRLTIAPKWLDVLQKTEEPLKRVLDEKNAVSQYEQKLEVTEQNYRWGMCQDAMATEKLAEGIRKFAADIVKVEEIISKMM